MNSPVPMSRWMVRCRVWLAGLGAVVIMMLLGVTWLGFPGPVMRLILSNANAGDVFIVARNLKLDLRGGLKAADVEVYRKGIAGPPFLEARELRVLFRCLERPRAGQSRIREIRLRDGLIRNDGGPGIQVWTRQPGTNRHTLSSLRTAPVFLDIDLGVVLSDFDVMGVWVESVQADVRLDRKGITLSRLSGLVGQDLQRGGFEGAVAATWAGQAEGRLMTTFDPRALLPLFRRAWSPAASVLEQFSFSTSPPRFDLSFTGELGSSPNLAVTGRMQASGYAYRGTRVGFATVTGQYRLGNGTNLVSLDRFLMVIGGRNAEGRATFDLSARTGEFELVSSVELGSGLRLSGVRDLFLEGWKLDSGARIAAAGHLDYMVPERSRVEAVLQEARIGYGRVQASDLGLRLVVSGQTNTFQEIQGKIGNGSFSGSLLWLPAATGAGGQLQGTAELIHVDADTLTCLFSSSEAWRMDGKLYGNLDLKTSGGTSPGESLSGHGHMAVRHSRLFRLPVFAGLMTELGRILPELDLSSRLVDADASFELERGRVTTRDFKVQEGPVTLTAGGSCGVDGTLDFAIRVELLKKTGLLAEAISGLFTAGQGFEFTLGGTLAKPKWSYAGRK